MAPQTIMARSWLKAVPPLQRPLLYDRAARWRLRDRSIEMAVTRLVIGELRSDYNNVYYR